MQNRFQSPVFWTAVAAQVLSLLVILQAITPTQSDTINSLIAAALQLFVTFGVLNNPTDPSAF